MTISGEYAFHKTQQIDNCSKYYKIYYTVNTIKYSKTLQNKYQYYN